jgi:hypothetical protein
MATAPEVARDPSRRPQPASKQGEDGGDRQAVDGLARLLPVDDAREPPVLDQKVPAEEIAVHEAARRVGQHGLESLGETQERSILLRTGPSDYVRLRRELPLQEA